MTTTMTHAAMVKIQTDMMIAVRFKPGFEMDKVVGIVTYFVAQAMLYTSNFAGCWSIY